MTEPSKPLRADEVTSSLNLETTYKELSWIFHDYVSQPANASDAIIVLDTNVLVLPYQISQDDLHAIGKVYAQLATADRLFIPARVAREFVNQRERRLAEMVSALNDKKSRLPSIDKSLSPILSQLEANSELIEAYDKMTAAKREYGKALDKLVATIRSWRGNDPVSQLYKEVFANRIVDLPEPMETLRKDWETRSSERRPPGYKDASKDDGGIGDFLIWRTLLSLGSKGKDIVFVTNEAKADWFVRSGREPLYARPELVAEYRTHSSGKSLRLCSLHELLAEMDVDAEVVSEVQKIEAANSASQLITLDPTDVVKHQIIMHGAAAFDYSTNDGVLNILSPTGVTFPIKFSKASDSRIRVHSDGLKRVGRVREPLPGERVILDQLDTSSRSYIINVGEAFAVQHSNGNILVARILHIKDDTQGASSDEVSLTYIVTLGPTFGVIP